MFNYRTAKKKKDPTEMRLTSEIADLDPDATPGVEVKWPNMKDLLHFEVTVIPRFGMFFPFFVLKKCQLGGCTE